jgi:hypothetical protein
MGLTLERKLSVGLMIPIVSSEKRREYVPVGSTAASMPPTFSPETTEISLSKCHFAPSKARRILRGVSPRRARVSHPPVSSLASVTEQMEV